MDIKISVVTVVLNDISGLRKTAGSVLDQTHMVREWIVCDGGSKDGTLDYLNSMADRVSWISERDQGIYSAMNKGIVMSNGEYVVFMNAGDIFFDDSVLAKVAAGHQTADGQGIDILYGGAMLHFPNGRERYRPPRLVEDSIWHGLPANHQATFYRRKILGERPYDLQYGVCGDYYLAAKLFREGARAAYLNEPLAKFEVGGASYRQRRRLFTEPYRIQRDVLGLSLPSRLASFGKRLISTAGFVVLSQPYFGNRK